MPHRVRRLPGVGTWGLAKCWVMAATMDSVPPARTMASFTSSLPAMARRALNTCFTTSYGDGGRWGSALASSSSCAGPDTNCLVAGLWRVRGGGLEESLLFHGPKNRWGHPGAHMEPVRAGEAQKGGAYELAHLCLAQVSGQPGHPPLTHRGRHVAQARNQSIGSPGHS